MFNNRMLAVAAVLVMAVPALGAATPIVVPPVPEQLVEGHTVFTVIEIVAVTQTNEVRFAAAVAVLVREYQARNVAQRFPGVLWFNDQYLTNPTNNDAAYRAFRYPCGGAVMAVNAGDPDPRVVIADLTVRQTTVVDPVTGAPTTLPGVSGTVGDDTETYTYPPWVKPYPGTYTYNNDYAWIGADVGPTTVDASDPATNVDTDTQYDVWSDTVVGTAYSSADKAAFGLLPNAVPYDYRESYLITDPNDHSWIIDLYDFYTRYGAEGTPAIDTNGVPPSPTATGLVTDTDVGEEVWGPTANNAAPNRAAYGTTGATYAWPVWVVNTLGSPVFIPDYGVGIRDGNEFYGENCVPFRDLVHDVTTAATGASCGIASPPPFTDDPCLGYMEPSRNDFCYGGQDATGGCVHGSPGNTAYNSKGGVRNTPLRQYNALLYFHLEDLRVWDGTIKDHCNFNATLNGCDPRLSPDTNGCSEEQYAWGPNPPQAAYDWPCPGGDDDAEGNSHPFHPTPPPPHVDEEPCPPSFRNADWSGTDAYRANPSNHGGSTYVTPMTPTYRTGSQDWYQVYAPCDYAHTTRNIDIYFSPAGRPFPPPVRSFNVIDLEGSTAPFQDYHSSYPGVP